MHIDISVYTNLTQHLEIKKCILSFDLFVICAYYHKCAARIIGMMVVLCSEA